MFKKGDRIKNISDNVFSIKIGGIYIMSKDSVLNSPFVYFKDENGHERMRYASKYKLVPPDWDD